MNPQAAAIPRRAVAFALVLVLHVLLFWGLRNGFAQNIIKLAQSIQTILINETVPVAEAPPPPPPTFTPPKLPSVTMPEIAVEMPPGNTITTGPPGPAKTGSLIVPPRLDPRRPWTQPAYAEKPGSVVLQLAVDTTGKITAAHVAQSSGNKMLDDATVQQALRDWHLLPATEDGKPIAVQLPWKVNYLTKPKTAAELALERQLADAQKARAQGNCVTVDQVADMLAVNADTILVKLRTGAYKRVPLRGCSMLAMNGDLTLGAVTGLICERDAVPTRVGNTFCTIGNIANVSETELAKLLAPPPPDPALRSADAFVKRRAEQEQPRTAVAFDTNAFEKFVGHYQLALDEFVTVTRDGARYFHRRTGGKPIEVFPESETKFFAKTVPAQVSFERNSTGNAVALVLHEGGAESVAVRVEASVATASEAALLSRIAAKQPDAQREKLLRQYIDSEQRGEIPEAILTPALFADTQQSWAQMQKASKPLGKFKALKFVRVDPQGLDVYQAVHQRGYVLWSVGSLSTDRKLEILRGAAKRT